MAQGIFGYHARVDVDVEVISFDKQVRSTRRR